MNQSDRIRLFVDERIEKSSGYRVPIKRMYEMFYQWCYAEGYYNEKTGVDITPIIFGKRFKELTGAERLSTTSMGCV